MKRDICGEGACVREGWVHWKVGDRRCTCLDTCTHTQRVSRGGAGLYGESVLSMSVHLPMERLQTGWWGGELPSNLHCLLCLAYCVTTVDPGVGETEVIVSEADMNLCG